MAIFIDDIASLEPLSGPNRACSTQNSTDAILLKGGLGRSGLETLLTARLATTTVDTIRHSMINLACELEAGTTLEGYSRLLAFRPVIYTLWLCCDNNHANTACTLLPRELDSPAISLAQGIRFLQQIWSPKSSLLVT